MLVARRRRALLSRFTILFACDGVDGWTVGQSWLHESGKRWDILGGLEVASRREESRRHLRKSRITMGMAFGIGHDDVED